MDITIPKLGLTMESAVLTRWLVADGDSVVSEQPVAEIATDKVEFEILSPADGVLTNLVSVSEEELSVGAVIAELTPA